ncbi:DNA-binding response regulator [Synergistales bacterium]|nr:DNA-binding response regulator [Synergistales bacterium]
MSQRVLIIEDDLSLAEIERDFLEIDGFETCIAGDGKTGLEKARSGVYDLILLDLMLPGLDGLSLCKLIRNDTNIPILMVSAKREDADKIRGLGLGADDYITKPFSPSELVARVKANLAQYKRMNNAPPAAETPAFTSKDEIKIGEITVNKASRRVFARGLEVSCTNKEYELLLFLMSNPDRVFSKELLYDHIWGEDAYGDIKTVLVHINRLREKIEADPSNPLYIKTVRGAGYRFSG